MIHRRFVYGTLAPGRLDEHVLEGVPGEWEPATVRGDLLPEGWGAGVGFPGIVIDEQGPEVEGLVFSSQSLEAHWERLDDFEGDGYQRVLTVARLKDGRTVDAHICVLRSQSGPDSPPA